MVKFKAFESRHFLNEFLEEHIILDVQVSSNVVKPVGTGSTEVRYHYLVKYEE